jgi:rhodanese-related sulfurtransferase
MIPQTDSSTQRKRIIVIGGSAAGPKAAARARRLDELPRDKGQEIICYCKISLRGYEAARVLEGRGWTNVKVLEGGIVAWPFPREK